MCTLVFFHVNWFFNICQYTLSTQWFSKSDMQNLWSKMNALSWHIRKKMLMWIFQGSIGIQNPFTYTCPQISYIDSYMSENDLH
jgi:hypothetical protein